MSVIFYCRLPKLAMSISCFQNIAYAMMKNGKWSYVSQLISIVDFLYLVWVLMCSELAYAM